MSQNPTLSANLDDLARGYEQDRLNIKRADTFYELDFTSVAGGSVKVVVYLTGKRFQIDQAVAPKLTSEGIADADELYTRVRGFLYSLRLLGLDEHN
jgi:hypothetical protein